MSCFRQILIIFLFFQAATVFGQAAIEPPISGTDELPEPVSGLPEPLSEVPGPLSASPGSSRIRLAHDQQPPPVDADELDTTDEALQIPGCQSACNSLDEFWGYRTEENWMSWIVGDGDQFGAFSLSSNHYQHRGVNSGFGVGLEFHFLAGPEQTDMPPRVFDFGIGYQKRNFFGTFGYDVACSVRASSDFEGSSREGIRFPSHAVGYLVLSDAVDLVFGADYLDRGDIKWLPVGGLILHPHPDVRVELVFPYPRIDFQLSETQRCYVSGALGGNTWAIERDSLEDDLVTYHDLRVGVGLQQAGEDGSLSAFEIAYLFDRKLEHTSGIGDYRPNGTVMIRSVQSY